MATESDLIALARSRGIDPDFSGTSNPVGDQTLVALLTALGEDVSTPESVRRALHAQFERTWRQVVPPTIVARQGSSNTVQIHAPLEAKVQLTILLEAAAGQATATQLREVGQVALGEQVLRELALELPDNLPIGYHRLRVNFGTQVAADAALIVVPERLEVLPEIGESGNLRGLAVQLYQVRSAQSWGIGDLGDLAHLVGFAATSLRGDFVLLNPLHAAEPVAPIQGSPYLPTSRAFTNPSYLDLAAIPDSASLSPATRARLEKWAGHAQSLNSHDSIERAEAWRWKHDALRVMAKELLPRHRLELQAYRRERGTALERFALWWALAQIHGPQIDQWPIALRDPRSPAAQAAAVDLADEIAFACWLQWLMERQLATVQRQARSMGMRVGLIHDLAVGINPNGADAWGQRQVLVSGASVGAPPDDFNQLGQNWNQPPWDPRALSDAEYAPFRDVIRSVMARGGGIRIDHVMGLYRLWWIPRGMRPADGAYVHYDAEAMLGIVLLEAQRAGVLVIGEDLGVVQDRVREELTQRGVLGTSIVWFEWTGGDGQMRPLAPERYRSLCLASLTSHDLPPTAGLVQLAQVDLRERLGLLIDPVAERSEETQRLAAMQEALVTAGLLPADRCDEADATVDALHAWLARTPCLLQAISLNDLVGDIRPVNQPGTDREYPNWRLPLTDPAGRLIDLNQALQLAYRKIGHIGRV